MEALPNNQLLVLAKGQTGVVKLRYNADGTLDATYGTAGRIALAANPTGFTPGSQSNYADLLTNGRVVMEGSAAGSYALAVYNADGSLDTSFGTGGIATVPNQPESRFSLQPDGKILVAGATPVQTAVGVLRAAK